LGCWVSPCYGPFSLGARFETYGPFISLIFQFFFSGRSKPRITETTDTESADTVVRLYLVKEQIAKLGNMSEDHAANKTVINEFQAENCGP